MLLKKRFEKEDAALATHSSTTEEKYELSVLLEGAASAMNDARLETTKAKDKKNKEGDDELYHSGAAAREASLKRRTHRNDTARDKHKDSADADEESEGDGLSLPAKRRRRRDGAKDEKDDALVDLIERDAAERRDAQRRTSATQEERLDLDKRRSQHQLDMNAAQRQQEAAADIARAKAAADAAAAFIADHEKRTQTMALMAELVRSVKKN